jgi:hypothetical protein
MGARQHKLRVMQRKGVQVGAAVILPHFGHSVGFSGRETREQCVRSLGQKRVH